MSFPAELSNAIDGVTEVVAAHLNNLEAKVGIDNSAVATSLDYLLKNASSIDPGHQHTAGAFSGGNDGEVFYKAAGAWGPGTPDVAGLVAKSGDQSIAGVKTFTSIPLGPDSNPTTDNQLARKAYVDLMLPLAGGTMSGNIAMNNHKVTGLTAASGSGEALRYDEWTTAQDPGHKHSKLWASDGSPVAVTVDAAGNVGIGTVSPGAKLHILSGIIKTRGEDYTSDQLYSMVGNNNVVLGTLGVSDNTTSGAGVLLKATNYLAAYTGGSERLRIDSSGNVGIGTTSPGKKLDVSGYIRGIGVINTLNSAPGDGDLAAGECAWWFDKTNGAAKFMIKAKQDDGTVKTASISLS
jgi:hypothetical protein